MCNCQCQRYFSWVWAQTLKRENGPIYQIIVGIPESNSCPLAPKSKALTNSLAKHQLKTNNNLLTTSAYLIHPTNHLFFNHAVFPLSLPPYLWFEANVKLICIVHLHLNTQLWLIGKHCSLCTGYFHYTNINFTTATVSFMFMFWRIVLSIVQYLPHEELCH